MKMTIKKLSKTQQKALVGMHIGIWYSAYDLQVSIATLNALHRMNLVERRSDIGVFYSPRTAVEFKRK